MQNLSSQEQEVVSITDRVSTDSSTTEQQGATIGDWLTIERLLFGLCILAGGALRFLALAVQPLSSSEAATAWASWLASRGLDASNSAAGLLAASTPATSSLLYSLNATLFWLAGGNDVLARFLPAVFGTGMVVLAWYLRPHLGRWAALALALLIAFDPWLVAYSRLADGAILTAFFGLLTLTGLLYLGRGQTNVAGASSSLSSSRSGWLTLTAVSAGLLLVSGVQAWSFVPVLLLYVWLCGDNLPFLGQSADADSDDDEVQDETEIEAASSTSSSMVIWWSTLAAAALLGGTGWLAFPEGMSYLSTSLSAWMGQITAESSAASSAASSIAGDGIGYSLRWLSLRLLVDQPLLIVFGLIGIVSLWFNRGANDYTDIGDDAEIDNASADSSQMMPSRWPLFILIWLVWGMILALLPGRMPSTLLLIQLPLLFAAAHVGGRIFGRQGQSDRTFSWVELVSFMSMLTALSVATWIMLTTIVHASQFQVSQVRMLLVVAGAMILTVVFFVLWSSRQQALWMVALFAFALLSLVSLSSSVQLSHRFDVEAPDAFFGEYTDPDVRALAQNVEVLSSQRTGGPNQATVIAALNGGPDPLLGWYLRDMQNLRWGSTPAAADTEDARQTPFLISYQRVDAAMGDGDQDASAPDGYLGSEYGLRLRWLPTELPQYVAPEEVVANEAETDEEVVRTLSTRINERWGAEYRPLLRWIFYREVDGTPPTERVVLWVPVIEN